MSLTQLTIFLDGKFLHCTIGIYKVVHWLLFKVSKFVSDIRSTTYIFFFWEIKKSFTAYLITSSLLKSHGRSTFLVPSPLTKDTLVYFFFFISNCIMPSKILLVFCLPVLLELNLVHFRLGVEASTYSASSASSFVPLGFRLIFRLSLRNISQGFKPSSLRDSSECTALNSKAVKLN